MGFKITEDASKKSCSLTRSHLRIEIRWRLGANLFYSLYPLALDLSGAVIKKRVGKRNSAKFGGDEAKKYIFLDCAS